MRKHPTCRRRIGLAIVGLVVTGIPVRLAIAYAQREPEPDPVPSLVSSIYCPTTLDFRYPVMAYDEGRRYLLELPLDERTDPCVIDLLFADAELLADSQGVLRDLVKAGHLSPADYAAFKDHLVVDLAHPWYGDRRRFFYILRTPDLYSICLTDLRHIHVER